MAQGRTIVGIFSNSTSAENAIEALHHAGFGDDQLKYSGHGRMGGGFWESIKSTFTGNDSTSDNVVNDLKSLGLTQDEAMYYAQEYQAGHPIVAVNSDDRPQDAAQIMQTNGGYSYAAGTGASAYEQRANTSGQYAQAENDTSAYQYNQSTYNQAADAPQVNAYDRSAEYANRDVDTDEARRLRLREERLQAEKQTVQSGEVNLRKEVVTEQQQLDVPVAHEEVYIEQQDLGGRVSDAPIGQDETIRVPVREEQVNVSKTPVETREVKIGKRTVQDTQHVSDTVQREEARIERSGNTPMRDTTTDDDINNR